MLDKVIRKSLNTRIAPMIYIMMGVSVIIGFCFGTGLLVGTSESVLYTTGVLVHKQAWGAVLFFTALTAEIGFFIGKDSLISIGGVSGFCAWLFACIALTLSAHWYILLTVGLFHLLFHGYIVLATALGVLRRQPIQT